MTHYFIDNQPEEWDQLAVIYDKDGAYKQNYIESKMRDQMANAVPSTTTVTADGETVGPNENTKDETKQE